MPIDETAPGELELVREFVNTRYLESGRDALESPAALVAWLAAHGVATGGATATDEELALARAVREALRDLADANHGVEVPGASLAVLRDAAARAPLALEFRGAGDVEPKPVVGGIEGALGRLLAIVYRAIERGEWSRLKACRASTCRWLYYDRSKNRSAAWCSMAVCGNRAKARRRRAAGA